MSAAGNAGGIAAEFLALVARVAACMALPRVRRLHLPAGTAERSRDAEFCALELEDGSIGLSFVWLGATLPRLRAEHGGLPLAGAAVADLATWYGERDELRRTLGFAAINALSQCLFSRAGFVPDTATDSVGLLQAGAGDHIGMVGLFPPLIERILASGARLSVAELDPGLVREDARFRVTLDAAELASCNKVISTSTVLLNDTLDAVLGACRAARYFGIIGPSAGCLPDPLFARGVSTLGGTRIVDREGFVDALAAGRPWGRHAQKYCIRRDAYPGAAELVARAAR